MFKHHLISKLVLLALTILGVILLAGFTNSKVNAPIKIKHLNNKTSYVYQDQSGRFYYKDNNGHYYYPDHDGHKYLGGYYVEKLGHHYYRYHRYFPNMESAEFNPSALSMKVHTTLVNDPLLKMQKISVRNTRGGYVELIGRVDDSAQRQRAVELARSVEGVRYVEDGLRVGMRH